MAYQCSHCGAQAPAGARICFMCGGQVVEGGATPLSVAKTEIGEPLHLAPGAAQPHLPPAAPTPQLGAPPGMAPGGPPAMGVPGQPPGAPGMPPGLGVPGYGPPGAVPMGPGYPPAPRRSDDSTLKIGCGVAGCLGVGLVVVVVGLVLFYLLQSGSGPTASGPSSGGPSSGESPRSEAPSSGSLRSIVKEQVGPYRLVASSPNVADGPFRDGAVDSLGLSYKSPAGIEVKHFLVVYSSEAQAEKMPKEMIELIRKKIPAGQTFTVRSQPYKNRDGKVIGKFYLAETEPEVVMWHNGKLFAVANAPSDHARQFFKGVPY